jgi:hypothetical protein
MQYVSHVHWTIKRQQQLSQMLLLLQMPLHQLLAPQQQLITHHYTYSNNIPNRRHRP